MQYYTMSCVTVSLLFLASFVSSQTTYNLSPSYDIPALKVRFYEIRGVLSLTCHLNITGPTEKFKIEWRKDGNDVKSIPELKDRARIGGNEKSGKYTFSMTRAIVDDVGNYSCAVVNDSGETEHESEILVSSKPAVKVPPNTSVVEGEKLFIHCVVLGKPSPSVTWRVGNETYESSKDRIQLLEDLETGIPNSILVIEGAELSDRNEYVCMGRSNYSSTPEAESKTYVRVKDKLAALWPFLGICIEVVVLCAIILIYEKKRNKTELEESDTDQSPDQKNTPDNGKESDVRQRK